MSRSFFRSIVPSTFRSTRTNITTFEINKPAKPHARDVDDWARQETGEPDPLAADLEDLCSLQQASPAASLERALDVVEEQWAVEVLPGCAGVDEELESRLGRWDSAMPSSDSDCAGEGSERASTAEELPSDDVRDIVLELAKPTERAMVKPRGWSLPDSSCQDIAALKSEFRPALFGGLRSALQGGALEQSLRELELDARAAEASAAREAFAAPMWRGAERALEDGSLECALQEMAFEEGLAERTAVREDLRSGLFQGLSRAVDDGSLEEALEEMAFNERVEERDGVREDFRGKMFAGLAASLENGELERVLREIALDDCA